jgi:hypothetical protein
MGSKQNKSNITWTDDVIRPGARFRITGADDRKQGTLEFISEPEIVSQNNDGYVTVTIKAACLDHRGLPMTDLNFCKEDECVFAEENRELYAALHSFRFVLCTMIREMEKDRCIPEFIYSIESSRNTLFFNYVLLEKKMARIYPQFVVRIRRIAESLDEAFEKIYKFQIDSSIEQFKNTLERVDEFKDHLF